MATTNYENERKVILNKIMGWVLKYISDIDQNILSVAKKKKKNHHECLNFYENQIKIGVNKDYYYLNCKEIR